MAILRNYARGFMTIGVFALLAGGAAVVACSEDLPPVSHSTPDGGAKDSSTTTTTDTGTPFTDLSLVVNVTYTGAKKGVLIISLWPTASGPSSGTPIGLGTNENPTLPGTNKINIKNAPAGKAWAFGYMMVGAEHRFGPIPGDPYTPQGTEVTIIDGQTVTANVNFDTELPNPAGDGGTDGGTDGGSDSGDAGTD